MTLLNSGITGQNLTKVKHKLGKSLPPNLFKSEV